MWVGVDSVQSAASVLLLVPRGARSARVATRQRFQPDPKAWQTACAKQGMATPEFRALCARYPATRRAQEKRNVAPVPLSLQHQLQEPCPDFPAVASVATADHLEARPVLILTSVQLRATTARLQADASTLQGLSDVCAAADTAGQAFRALMWMSVWQEPTVAFPAALAE